MTAEFSSGHWLQQRRRALGLTQKELGQRVGYAAETVRKIEADARRPSRQVATLLAVALEIPESDHLVFIDVVRGIQPVAKLSRVRKNVDKLTTILRFKRPLLPMTFLFADIENSLRLWEQIPQAMSLVLIRFKEILHQIIVAYDGEIVSKTTTEKGVCAAFAGPLDALEAAEAAQRAIQVESWGETGPLRVRMALHTGVVTKGRDNYFGPALDRIKELIAVSSHGRILLSHTLMELVRDWLPSSVNFDIHDPELRSLVDITQERSYEYDINSPNRMVGSSERISDSSEPIGGSSNLIDGPLRMGIELIAEFTDGAWFVPIATNSAPEQMPSE